MAVRGLMGRDLHIVEVGSWVGESAVAMSTELATQGSTITCVDTFEGSIGEPQMLSRIEQLGGAEVVCDMFLDNTLHDSRIKLIRKTSTEAAEQFRDASTHIVFLDAGHAKKDVLRDIGAWRSKVHPFGVLCGHDYGMAFPGVVEAVDEQFAVHGVPVYHPAGSNIWAVQNKDVRQLCPCHPTLDSLFSGLTDATNET